MKRVAAAPPRGKSSGNASDQTKIALRMVKNTIDRKAPAGNVINQDMKIDPTTPR